MSIINEPQDLLGLAFKNLLDPLLDDEKIQKKLKNWKKVIAIEIKEMYGITITFNNGSISIEYDIKPKYDLKLIISFDALMGSAEGKMNMISALLKRKIKVKKMYHIFTILKTYRMIFPAIKKAMKEPVLPDLLNLL